MFDAKALARPISTCFKFGIGDHVDFVSREGAPIYVGMVVDVSHDGIDVVVEDRQTKLQEKPASFDVRQLRLSPEYPRARR